ncbi:hypothetical protein E0Z10_g3613 [Xylaria hypoxylon]|uniref:Uncharacterized protein n=1 Tax=Xylaria hypoxylon TaxID=37992 RepID=A0A4Z0Z0Y0_9PEZI|nr:hypothetical protein E0Z10_g3613 [Xylaria hypoxylon]
MEPPSKRLRLDPSPYADDGDDEENQDELAMTPAQFDTTQNPMYELDKGRAKAATRLKSTLEDIFDKYGKDFEGDDDVINFYTDEIEVDNGHVQSLENRKNGATEDSLSSEEEERILNGKSGGRKKKLKSKSKSKSKSQSQSQSQSQSLTPTPVNHTADNQRLPFNSPWNGQPGLGTYRLSSLAFSSSPYDSCPPFDFGRAMFGNSHIDPAWQTPDLPIRTPHYHYGSLIETGGGQFGSFGGPSNHVVKRLASAKSFFRNISCSSEADDGEDDIIFGRNNQDRAPYPRLEGHEKTSIPATSRSSSHPSSRSPDQQPSFHGVGLTEDELRTKPDSLGQEAVQTIATDPSTKRVVLAPPQSAKGDSQYHRAARSSHSSSPSRPKRGRRKQLDTRKYTNISNEALKNESNPLQPNMRKIEIIFPMMKSLFPTEIGQTTKGTAPVADETLQPPDMEQRVPVSEDIEATLGEDKLHTSQSTCGHADVVHHSILDLAEDSRVVPAARSAEDPKHATSTPKFRELRRRQSKRTREHTDLSRTNTSLHDEKTRENTCIEASRELGPSQTSAGSFTNDNITDGIHQIGQKSDCDNETDRIAPGQPLSPIAKVGMGEEQATPNTSVEGDLETKQVDEQNPTEASVQSLLSAEFLCDGTSDGTTEMSDSLTTEAVVPEASESQELQSSHSENEDIPRDEPDPSSVGVGGEESLPIHSHAPDSTAALEAVAGSSEVVDAYEARISTFKQDVGSRSPEYSAIRGTTESDIYSDLDCLPPTFEALEIRHDLEHSTPNEPLFESVLVAEIDDLRLYSDHPVAQRSPSLGAMELPDRDLSVFPAISDAYSTSDFILRLPSRPAESDDPRVGGVGRSPSPELGTPIAPEIVRRTAPRTKGSPAPATPTRKRSSNSANPRSSHRRTPSSKRFPLTSLVPGGIDDDSDDELSMASSFSGASSRFHSPFFRANTNDNTDLPPLLSTPRKKLRKHSLLIGSPPSSTRTPKRILGTDRSINTPPATESRVGRSQARRGRSRAVHSSPLARRVAERLLSSPTKRHRATPTRSPSVVASPHGTLRRCGENGFACERDFCFTCCI